MKKELTDLNDIKVFVNAFYSKVQLDEIIGPIFNSIISNWQPHLERMYQFWNAALFGVAGFKGNPFAKHAPLGLEKQHFERWLLLFNETIDTYFEGVMADETKKKANLMAIMFLSKIENKPGGPNRVIV